jgi:hypothetical protein
MAKVTVCCQINTKHINTVWAKYTILEFSACWRIKQAILMAAVMVKCARYFSVRSQFYRQHRLVSIQFT